MTYMLPDLDGRQTPREGAALRTYTEAQLDQIPQVQGLDPELRFAMRVVSQVLPFRVNEYVVSQLIDWDQVPNDPLFQLVFPQRGMLEPDQFDTIADLLRSGAERQELRAAADAIRYTLNPHPAGQQLHNVPVFRGERLEGVQHKYTATVLFFPSQGQTCHSYCTFCFRWAQFVGMKELKMAGTDPELLQAYLAENRQVSDLLVTGGDPMVMKTKVLRRYLEPLLEPRFDHVQTIRIGSKALSFWPHRFVTDGDADDLLRLFESLAEAGKHVAFMAHVDHWRELETSVCQDAIRRLRDAGVTIRSQAPLLRNVNDDVATWTTMWRNQVRMGIVPYYMFVERDTGARGYFEVPLSRAYEIYRGAVSQVSGLGRTARGPSMSTGPGKVEVTGTAEINGEKVFVLRFLQARDKEWLNRPFFARYDTRASWLDHLRPAFGQERFFFEERYAQICHELETAG